MYIFRPLVVAFLLSSAFVGYSQSFNKVEPVFSPVPGRDSQFEWVDLDGDGDLDVLTFRHDIYVAGNSSVTLYENTGQSFRAVDHPFGLSINLTPVKYALGDHDQDGDVDLLVVDQDTLRLLKNEGKLSFSSEKLVGIPVDQYLTSLNWIDIDGDGDLDINILNAFYLNNDGLYTPSLHALPPSIRNSFWADINQDGLTDFVAPKQMAVKNGLFLYVNQGDGVFELVEPAITAVFGDYEKVLWADADGDQDLDLFITESEVSSFRYKTTLFKNTFSENGKATFKRAYAFKNLNYPRPEVGDVNLDGLPDLILNGEEYATNQTLLYLNQSTTDSLKFKETDLSISATSYDMDVVDINKDQVPDLFFSGAVRSTNEHSLAIYSNSISNPLPQPTIPSQLTTQSGSETVLSWNPVSTPGSYYNIEVRRNGNLFLSALSREDGGLLWPQSPHRRILAAKAVIRNLPAGTYTWRVQTLDGGLRSSEFSAYETFTVGQAPTNLVLEHPELTKVTLKWTDNIATESGFAIFRRSTNGVLTKIASVPANTTVYNDSSLPTNVHFEYLVRAESNGVLSAPSNIVQVYTPLFEEKQIDGLPKLMTTPIHSADLDNDQDYDLAFAGGSMLFNNSGNGKYTSQTTTMASNDRNFFVRDIDNDGDQDICRVIGGMNEERVAIFRNDQGTFTKVFETPVFQYVHQLGMEDFDHDGLVDIFYSHSIGYYSSTAQYTLLLQKKPLEFTDSRYPFVPELGSYKGTFSIGDLNGDGFSDVIFKGNDYNDKAQVFKNLSGSSFAEVSSDLPNLSGDVVIFDFNQDGKADIVRSTGTLRWYEGAGNFMFKSPQEVDMYGLEAISQIADFDLNGLPDLLIRSSRNMTLMQNYGQGNFTTIPFPINSERNSQLGITDFDNDGDLDLVKQTSEDYDAGKTYFYENKIISNGTFTNAAPTPPTKLAITRQDSVTVLSWVAATDDKTPAEFLSYNLLLVNDQGKTIFNSETNAAGNFRQRLSPGNLGQVTQYTINHLPVGHYTARLQTLDAAFRVSSYSQPISFNILAGPTQLAIERILLNKVKLTWQDNVNNENKIVVQRRTLHSAFEVIAELPANTTSLVDSLLHYNEVYIYRVYAIVNGVPTANSPEVEWDTKLFVENRQSKLPKLSDNALLDVGDYTNDGRMDLAIFGGYQDGYNPYVTISSVVENTGTDWVQHPVGLDKIFNSQCFLHDFNGDHQLDLLQYGFVGPDSKGITSLFLNQGNHAFEPTANLLTANPQSVISRWDYDSDNDLDVNTFETNSSGPFKKRLLRNDGAGTFALAEETDVTCYSCPQYQIPSDFDRDGDEDLLQWGYSSEGGNGLYLMLNVNGGLQSTKVVIPTGSASRIQIIDYNSDGWLDVFVLSDYMNGYYEKSKLYKNLGLNTDGIPHFRVVKDNLPAGDRIDSGWGDYDHDGDLDFFISGYPFTIYTNEGNDQFSQNSIPLLYSSFNKTRWLDIDNDGDLDLYYVGNIIPDYYTPQGVVLINQIITDSKGISNRAPAPPTALKAEQDETGMHLTWTPAKDDITPSTGLSYDVILFRNGKAITKAAINPVTGNRQKLEYGRSTVTALLRKLPIGAYSWKIQAVDGSYLGSALSVEGSFFFKPEPPEIGDTTIYRCSRTVNLTAIGESIEWYSDQQLTHKVASGVFSPETSQVVYVTQTIGGVRGIARKVNIQIYEKPAQPTVLENPIVYCENAVIQQVNLQAAGTSIKWYSDASLTQVAGTGQFITVLAESKFYYVTQTLQNCESLPLKIVVEPLPIDARIFYKEDSLFAYEKNGDYYQWFIDNKPVSNYGKNGIKYSGKGLYTVQVFKKGCWKKSEPFSVLANEPLLHSQINLFPNPTEGGFFLSFPAGLPFVKICVYDKLGHILYEKEVKDPQQQTISISSGNWSKGIYHVTIAIPQGQLKKNVVIY